MAWYEWIAYVGCWYATAGGIIAFPLWCVCVVGNLVAKDGGSEEKRFAEYAAKFWRSIAVGCVSAAVLILWSRP